MLGHLLAISPIVAHFGQFSPSSPILANFDENVKKSANFNRFENFKICEN